MTYLPELIGILALFLLCWLALGHLLGLHNTDHRVGGALADPGNEYLTRVFNEPRMMVGAAPDWTPEEEEAWNAMAAEYINDRPDTGLSHAEVKRDLKARSPLGSFDD